MEDVANSLILLWIMGLVSCVSLCPDKCQCHQDYFVYCKSASLTDDQLTQIIKELPSGVHLLDLGSNNLVNISTDLFLELPNLEYLYLSDNKISHIQDGAFQNQRDLRDLNLQRNSMVHLSSNTFQGLYSIKTINLASNNIRSISPKSFSGLHLLQQLYLQENKLDNISRHMFEGLDNLHLLDLSNNIISVLEDASFSYLKNLWNLRLNNNQLHEMSSKSFDELTSIRELDVSHNNIRDINFFASCQFRETIGAINLSHNSLTHIPGHVISTIRRLATLDLSQNRIASVSRSAFFGLSLLKLNLSANALTVIDRQMFLEVRKIVNLDLSFNNIKVIRTSSLDSFRETLYYLYIQNNELTEVNTGMFRGMKNLLVLDLDNNSITNIYDGSFEQLAKLEELRISHNKLTVVRASMLKGPPLRSVYLQCNALEKFVGFKFKNQKSEIHVHFNMTMQERNESTARVTWPYRDGSQLYWKVTWTCVSNNNSSTKPLGQEKYLPHYKAETLLTDLLPKCQYYVCIYPVFINKNILVEQCGYINPHPSRSHSTLAENVNVSQPLSSNRIAALHNTNVLCFAFTLLTLYVCKL